MTPHMPEEQHFAPDCIDTALGDQLWRRDDPECPDDLRARLNTHVTYCADCRLRLALQEGLAAGLRDGSLDASPRPARRRWAPWTGGLSAAALAAGLALVALLPPSAPHEDLTLRGDDGPAVERPVADEVVLGRRPTVRWTALAGATRYDVRVEAVGGDYAWTASTDAAEARIPADAPLPDDTRFRVRVAPVPAHLAPDGALRSSFRTGGPAAWLAHRARHGAATGRVIVGIGALGVLAGLAGLLRRPGAA